jgi:hypothetical protein
MFDGLVRLANGRPRKSRIRPPIVVIGADIDAGVQWEPLNTPQASPSGLAPGPGRRTLWNVVSTPVLPPFDVRELSHPLATPREPSHDHDEIAPCRGVPRCRLLPWVHGWRVTATRAHRLRGSSGAAV